MAVIAQGENLRTQENLFNWTLQSYVSDIVYFGNNSKEEESGTKAGPPDILDILKQISTHHLTQYQLFFIIPSTSALHGKNIKQFTDPLSPSDLVYAGQKSSLTDTCDLQAGIILSRELIKQVMTKMEWCARNRVSYDQSQSLENCVFHATKVKCHDPFEESPYKAQKYESSSTPFDSALLFYGATSAKTKNTLLHDLNVHNENLFNNDVKNLEASIKAFINSSKYDIVVNWPTGSNPKFKSTDRFDHDVSLSFNQTHQLGDDEYDPATKLDIEHTKDIQEILNQCNILSDDFNSGWKRVDVTRGNQLYFRSKSEVQ